MSIHNSHASLRNQCLAQPPLPIDMTAYRFRTSKETIFYQLALHGRCRSRRCTSLTVCDSPLSACGTCHLYAYACLKLSHHIHTVTPSRTLRRRITSIRSASTFASYEISDDDRERLPSIRSCVHVLLDSLAIAPTTIQNASRVWLLSNYTTTFTIWPMVHQLKHVCNSHAVRCAKVAVNAGKHDSCIDGRAPLRLPTACLRLQDSESFREQSKSHCYESTTRQPRANRGRRMITGCNLHVWKDPRNITNKPRMFRKKETNTDYTCVINILY
jgi:hypothetical protein